MANSQFIYIQQHFFLSGKAALFSATNVVFFTFFGFSVIVIAVIYIRYRFIFFLYAALHLVVQLFLKSFGRSHHRFQVSVFFIQVIQPL